MKYAPRTTWVIGIWAAVLALAGYALGATTQIGSDLRLFLPKAETPAERILLEQLKDGPGTRLLLLALSGADNSRLAEVSDQMSNQLRSNAAFTQVENGSLHTDARMQEQMFRYRYLLTPRDNGCNCDSSSLHAALQDRLMELGSPAGAVMQDLLLRDPSGELTAIIDAWQGVNQPQIIEGVWFATDSQRALLLAQTAAPGFDADQQHRAIDAIQQALLQADPSGEIHLDITGPGAFTALLEQSVRSDVTALGMAEGIGSVLFLSLILLSLRHVVLGSLTLATAGVIALLAVTLIYPSVHGITLAFGFTLLGVAMDYPVHLLLHLERDQSAAHSSRQVWPTLRLSILTTCIAYCALIFAGFNGLAQLGTFTVCGLLATAAVIRWLLPTLADNQAARRIPDWVKQVQRAPRLPWLPTLVIPVALLALLLSPQPLWNNELSGLTPVPQSLQDLDTELRTELGAPDLRYVLAIRANSPQAALERDESLSSGLQQLVQQNIIGNYSQPSSLLPSVSQQLERRAALPASAVLQSNLQSAVAGLPFRAEVFADFINDVEASRTLPPLQITDLDQGPLADRLAATLFNTDQESVALITLGNVANPAALASWVNTTGDDVLLLDLKQVSEQLVERFRNRALLALGVALLVIAALLLAQLPRRAALAVLLPVIATLLAEVAIFNWLGISLTLFHIVSLLLVGGLCFDYGLFFNRSETSSAESLRTRFAVMACWLSTTGAFALLLISQLPVLRAIGSTVACGVTIGFIIALLARHVSAENK